jgi:hypothetical protein
MKSDTIPSEAPLPSVPTPRSALLAYRTPEAERAGNVENAISNHLPSPCLRDTGRLSQNSINRQILSSDAHA